MAAQLTVIVNVTRFQGRKVRFVGAEVWLDGRQIAREERGGWSFKVNTIGAFFSGDLRVEPAPGSVLVVITDKTYPPQRSRGLACRLGRLTADEGRRLASRKQRAIGPDSWVDQYDQGSFEVEVSAAPLP